MNQKIQSIQNTALILVIILMLPAVIVLSACNNNQASKTDDAPSTTATQTQQQTQDEKSAEAENEPAKADEVSGDDKAAETKGGNPVVIIKTSKGDIKLELDKENAPISVDNFIAYVNDGFYEGTIFHRVINNFMIQGGGITTDMQQKPGNPPIKNEADNGLKNDRGTIAMARTGVVDSATSQFFINTVDNEFLNHGKRDFGYAVFGKVVDGMEVVDAIQEVQTGPGDVPNEQIVIESVTIVE